MSGLEGENKEFENPITARTIIEVLGKPKKHVNNTLKLIVNAIDNKPNIKVLKQEIFEAEEKEDNVFAGFVELEIKVKDLESLTMFCFEFLPSSVEVLEPASINVDARFLTNFYTDLLLKVHKVDDQLKALNLEKKILEDKIVLLMRNIVILVMSRAKKEMDIQELSLKTGLRQEQLSVLMEKWVEDGFFQKTDKGYALK